MAVFSGAYEHVLDDKGRAVLPLGLRKCVSEPERKPYLKRGFKLRVNSEGGEIGPRLELLPVDRFEARYQELKAQFATVPGGGQEKLLAFTGLAAHIDLDDQFRFAFPPKYLQHMGLGREIYFVGTGDGIQIWRKEDWDRYEEAKWSLLSLGR